MFRSTASSPTRVPCSIYETIAMLFAPQRGKPARIHAHGNATLRYTIPHETIMKLNLTTRDHTTLDHTTLDRTTIDHTAVH